MRHPSAVGTSIILVAALALSACSADDVTTARPPAQGAITVNASTQWAYVSLPDSAQITPVPSASESTAWDIAFNSTSVTLNGGQAGPGGIQGACICQNVAATGTEVLAMTPESQKAAFDAVTSVPASVTWTSDVMTPAVSAFYTGTGTSAVADPTRVFLVRLSDSLSFAKVHVTALTSPTATSAGKVTLEYAVQSSSTGALGAVQTMVVDLTTAGAKSVDLNTGALTTSASDWDLRLDGFTIRVNGGVSGPGKGAAALATTTFAATTSASTQPEAYKTDTYAGVFGTSKYYRYNIAGDNKISPTFDVYLLKRGSTVYKVQILNYYSSTGLPRYITFRYKQISG
jgi:hypothetical protein